MTPRRKTVGIMGGFGPLAGAHFYRRLVELTDAASDDDHLGVLLLSDPHVPSRLRHLAGEGPSPVSDLLRMAARLAEGGADVIAIPSATVHAYHAAIAQAMPVPVLHLPRAAIHALKASGARRVALLATTATVRLGLYLGPAEECAIALDVPDGDSQDELMRVIAAIKGGLGQERAAERLRDIAGRPWAAAADRLLLGCTELPAVFPHGLRPSGTFDATDELARAAILAAGGRTVQ